MYKQIKQFLREHYSDQALERALHYAECGLMSRRDYQHCLLGMSDGGWHYHHMRGPGEWAEAQFVVGTLGRRINPLMVRLIKEEMARRHPPAPAKLRQVTMSELRVQQEQELTKV